MSINEDQLTTTESAVHRYSTANKAGFVLAILLGASNLVGLASPTPEGEVGPPLAVLIFGAVVGIAIVACVVVGWLRGSRAAIRAAAIMLVLTAITALPAFVTPDVPAPLVATAGVFVVLTIVTLVLMLKPTRQ
jgi:hypothetical protein